MRRHSIIGERILGGVPSLERRRRTGALVARALGRPWLSRLAWPEKRFPWLLGSFFVADAFCAMTEDRPYAAARSVQSARQELRACSGTQFDPAVVTAFLAALDGASAPTATSRTQDVAESSLRVTVAHARNAC